MNFSTIREKVITETSEHLLSKEKMLVVASDRHKKRNGTHPLFHRCKNENHLFHTKVLCLNIVTITRVHYIHEFEIIPDNNLPYDRLPSFESPESRSTLDWHYKSVFFGLSNFVQLVGKMEFLPAHLLCLCVLLVYGTARHGTVNWQREAQVQASSNTRRPTATEQTEERKDSVWVLCLFLPPSLSWFVSPSLFLSFDLWALPSCKLTVFLLLFVFASSAACDGLVHRCLFANLSWSRTVRGWLSSYCSPSGSS